MSDGKEVWKPIPDFEGYEASSIGRIRSFRKSPKEPIVLSLRKNSKGYLQCQVYSVGKKRRSITVHRLVGMAFLGKSKMVLNHINGIKTDNRIENLELCTLSKNTRHAYEMGLNPQHGERHKSSRLKVEQVLHVLESKESGANLARKFGVSQSSISLIRKGINWRHVSRKLAAIERAEGEK
jgi:hypothetical protein